MPTILKTQHPALAKIRKNRKDATKTFEHSHAVNDKELTIKAFLDFLFVLYCAVKITAYSNTFHTGSFQICARFPSTDLYLSDPDNRRFRQGSRSLILGVRLMCAQNFLHPIENYAFLHSATQSHGPFVQLEDHLNSNSYSINL